jgi:hypothetical protein
MGGKGSSVLDEMKREEYRTYFAKFALSNKEIATLPPDEFNGFLALRCATLKESDKQILREIQRQYVRGEFSAPTTVLSKSTVPATFGDPLNFGPDRSSEVKPVAVPALPTEFHINPDHIDRGQLAQMERAGLVRRYEAAGKYPRDGYEPLYVLKLGGKKVLITPNGEMDKWGNGSTAYRMGCVAPMTYSDNALADAGYYGPKELSELQTREAGQTLLLHMLPLGAAADNIASGNYFEATVSFAGDLGSVLTLGAGRVLKVGMALDAGVAGVRGVQAVNDARKEDWVGVVGKSGEIVLRLTNVGLAAVKLKNGSQVGKLGFGVEQGKAATGKTYYGSIEDLSVVDPDGFLKNMAKRSDIDPNGFLDVVLHSNNEWCEIAGHAETPEYLARLVAQDPKCNGKVRLLGCLTGNPDVKGGGPCFAQRFATALKKEMDLKGSAGEVLVEGTDGMWLATAKRASRNWSSRPVPLLLASVP